MFGNDTDIVRGYLVRSAFKPDFYELAIGFNRPGILEDIRVIIERIRVEREKNGKVYEIAGDVFGSRRQLKIIVRKLNADYLSKKAA